MSIFGDVRLDHRFDWMMDRIVSTGSVVLRRFGQDRAGELAAHRFLDNARIGVDEIIATFSERCGERCAGRRIIAVQDTTEINFSGRDRGRTGLGAGGNGDALGFFIHPVIAIDRDDEAVVGLVDAQIWTRQDAALAPHRSRIFADKESYRWLVGAERSRQRLSAAASVVMVGDREADIYALFARCPKAIDLVVRSAYDRSLSDDTRLLESLADLPNFGTMEVKVSARPGQKARLAKLRLRAGKINLRRPRNRLDDGDPKALCLTVVESYEVDPPKGVKPLNWRLLTSLAVDDEADAREIIHIYRQRWRIEEVFRALKSTGLRLEETQVEAAHRLFKLAALGIAAAVRIVQLVDARDTSTRPAKDVIDEALIASVALIGKDLEGKTKRQQNPHRRGSLAWLSWITARLGGWNCYYKPPGPKTMAIGWNQLSAQVSGVIIAQKAIDV